MHKAIGFINIGLDISEKCAKGNNQDIKNITDKVNFFVDEVNILSKLILNIYISKYIYNSVRLECL